MLSLAASIQCQFSQGSWRTNEQFCPESAITFITIKPQLGSTWPQPMIVYMSLLTPSWWSRWPGSLRSFVGAAPCLGPSLGTLLLPGLPRATPRPSKAVRGPSDGAARVHVGSRARSRMRCIACAAKGRSLLLLCIPHSCSFSFQ